MGIRARVLTAALGAILLGGVGFLWLGRGSNATRMWDPPAPGTVMVQDSSPNRLLSARVVAADTAGSYRFQILMLSGGAIVAERRIAAPVGYHPQLISLKWSQGQAVATIDHDFGDGNLEFKLAPPARAN